MLGGRIRDVCEFLRRSFVALSFRRGADKQDRFQQKGDFFFLLLGLRPAGQTGRSIHLCVLFLFFARVTLGVISARLVSCIYSEKCFHCGCCVSSRGSEVTTGREAVGFRECCHLLPGREVYEQTIYFSTKQSFHITDRRRADLRTHGACQDRGIFSPCRAFFGPVTWKE